MRDQSSPPRSCREIFVKRLRLTASPKSCASLPTNRRALYQSAWISTGLPFRGVTGWPPTRASIHVRDVDGSPAVQATHPRIHVNTEARSPHVPPDDVFQSLVKLRAHERPFVRIRRDTAGSPQKTKAWRRQCCIQEAALREGIGETIRQHSLIECAGKRQQNIARNAVPAGRKREPGQRDHRIAAPVGEPRVTRDHALIRPPADDELIGRGRQQIGSATAGNLGGFYRSRIRGGASASKRLLSRALRPSYRTRAKRAEEIFVKIEAALLLDRVLEIEVPVALLSRSISRCARTRGAAMRSKAVSKPDPSLSSIALFKSRLAWVRS